MASSSKHTLRIGAKDDASNVLKRIQGNTKSLSTSIHEFTGIVSNSITITKAFAGAVASAARPVADMVAEFARFETGMAEVSTITDLSAQEIAHLSDQVQDFAVKYAVDATEAAKALYGTISAGISATDGAAQAFEVMGQSVKFGKAALVDSATAVDLITTILNSYALEATEAERVSDLLFKTVQLGKTTGDELAGSFGRVTSIAATAGVSLEDLTAATVLLTRGGLSTDEAMTSLKAVITAIAAPTSQSKQAIEEMGLTMFSQDWLKRDGGIFGALSQLSSATDGNISKLKTVIPNIRALVGALAISQQEGALGEVLDGISDSAGATETALAKMTDTLGFKLDQVKATFDVFKASIGEVIAKNEAFNAILEIVVGSLAGVNTAVRDGGAGVDTLDAAITQVLTVAFPNLIDGVAHVVGAFEDWRASFEEIGLMWDLIVGGEKIGALLTMTLQLNAMAATGKAGSDEFQLLVEKTTALERQLYSAGESSRTAEKHLHAVADKLREVGAASDDTNGQVLAVAAAQEAVEAAGGELSAIALEHAEAQRAVGAVMADNAATEETRASRVRALIDEEHKARINSMAEFYTLKAGYRESDEAAVSASTTRMISQVMNQTQEMTRTIIPGLSSAAAAALIASSGGAAEAYALLNPILADAAAQGASYAAYARGGYVDSATLALIGEAGPETVVPESNPSRARELLGSMAERRPELFGSMGSGGNVVNVTVNGGDDSQHLAAMIADQVDEILGARIGR
jgi:TP901 family phage tail tape measure protein